ncbi:hypothetical protein [Planctomicrobium sp. SH527]|uniref:hypothetical protein n=1 Tax=Planctomicrobium sp. SH527 TaxID=3448123 RepID=UPI003F5AF2B1
MNSVVAQPIAGVSIERETELESVYPSLAALAPGRVIGVLMQKPASISNSWVRVTCQFLLGVLLAPVSLMVYSTGKLIGNYYVITNRCVSTRKIVGAKRIGEVRIADIHSITIQERPGYQFHQVGDVVLKHRDGKTLLVISAAVRPERVRRLILETQTAHAQVVQAQAVIQAREV